MTERLALIGIACCAIVELGALGCQNRDPSAPQVERDGASAETGAPSAFDGAQAGEGRRIGGVDFSWAPSATFVMGSPPGELERRPGEAQREVTLSRGFWVAKYETTQGLWKRGMGTLPGELTAELPEGDGFPVGNVNFAEAEQFCRSLTQLAHNSGDLPEDWEFRRLPPALRARAPL